LQLAAGRLGLTEATRTPGHAGVVLRDFGGCAEGETRTTWLGRAARLLVVIEIEPSITAIRQTFASSALCAGHLHLRALPLHAASLTMIHRHYGNLARDGREYAIVRRTERPAAIAAR
jgi:hypothetical protein